MNLKEFENKASASGGKYLLSVGEDDEPIKKKYLLKGVLSLLTGKIKYGSSKGEIKLLNKIAQSYHNVTSKNIILTNGSTFALNLCFLLDKNIKEIMLFKPTYPLYYNIASLFNLKINYVDLKSHGFELTFKTFKSSLTKGTKMCIINTPNNPTGIIYKEEELLKIINYSIKHQIYVVLDEVYEKITFSSYKLDLPINKYLIQIKSFSKSYNLTGLRLAYIVSSKENIDRFSYLQSLSIISIPKFIQEIGHAAYKRKAINLKKYQKNKELMRMFLRSYSLSYVENNATFYYFVDISEYTTNSYDFCLEVASKTGVILLPGVFFLQEGYIRISCARSKREIKKSIKCLSLYFNELGNKK